MARPAIHPGEILSEELEELEMSASDLARALDVPVNRITQILNGQRGITAATAIALGEWFKMSPEFWLNLQKQYELRKTEQESGSEIRSRIKPRVVAAEASADYAHA